VYSRIDGALLRKKIRFVFPMRQPLFQPPVSDYDPACVEALAKEFSGTDAKAIGSIFHLRDWQRLHPE
jgi:hypothetical protein